MEQEEKAELARLILSGNKIPAIKFYREATGDGLKEAKEAVEVLEAEMRDEFPEKFGAEAGGCASVLLVGFITVMLFSLCMNAHAGIYGS